MSLAQVNLHISPGENAEKAYKKFIKKKNSVIRKYIAFFCWPILLKMTLMHDGYHDNAMRC